MGAINELAAEVRTLDTSQRALRSFGGVVGLVLMGIAFVLWWRHDWVASPLAYGLGGIGSGLIALGLFAPALLKPLYRVWMALALVLGYVMTRLILALVFYLLMTPIGILRRTLGQDPMHRRPAPEQTSYWIAKEYTHDDAAARLEKYY